MTKTRRHLALESFETGQMAALGHDLGKQISIADNDPASRTKYQSSCLALKIPSSIVRCSIANLSHQVARIQTAASILWQVHACLVPPQARPAGEGMQSMAYAIYRDKNTSMLSYAKGTEKKQGKDIKS